ncbi:hypothetical protein EW146_g6020, partial [Bondarzewia mesenterica]
MDGSQPSHVSSKPLPPIPSRQNRLQHRQLTVEASAHLRNFIESALKEEDIESEKDKWVSGLERALGEMADAASRNGWLAGIRRRRDRTKQRKNATLLQAEGNDRETAHVVKEKSGGGHPRVSQAGEAESDRDPHLEQEQEQGNDVTGSCSQLSESALQRLRELASQQVVSKPKPSAKHLLLVVDPFNEPKAHHFRSPPDHEFFHPNRVCSFRPDVYAVPAGNGPDNENVSKSILFGLREWCADPVKVDVQLVGGTFSVNGASSLGQYDSIIKVLRLAIYMHLSLLLEQHFLSDSRVSLHFPKPAQFSIPAIPTIPIIQRHPSMSEAKRRRRDSLISSPIWSFFSKKGSDFLHRAVSIASSSSASRGSSIDLSHTTTSLPSSPLAGPRTSEDTPYRRIRGFSIFGDNRPPPVPAKEEAPPPNSPFQDALHRIEESKGLLSTSTGVIFPPPILLVRLAELEKGLPTRRLTGEERTGLTGILGWEGKEARGHGMSGTVGFVRQQHLSILYSQHVPLPRPSSSTVSNASQSSLLVSDLPAYTHCGPRALWRTYAYYEEGESSLGEMVHDICARAEEPCDRPGCESTRGHHELRWMHDGTRIVAKTHPIEQADEDRIEIWQSCRVCYETTPRCIMDDGTYLFSFAKFLELLVYSRTICTLTPSLCPHTTPPPQPWTGLDYPLPQSRLNIIRHFSYKSHTVSFTVSTIEDIFELRVPRLQITRSNVANKRTEKAQEKQDSIQHSEGEEEKRDLRKEINNWWQRIAEHLDKLEVHLSGDDASSYHKSLPRLPSADEAYESSSLAATPKVGAISLASEPSTISTSTHDTEASSASTVTLRLPQPERGNSRESYSDASILTADGTDPIQLLTNMRHTFQRTEQMLYAQLSQTPVSTLNDTRRSFYSAAQGASKRLSAWEKKHLSKAARAQFAADRQAFAEPEWWNSGCHAVPGSDIIVREEDWGSIIAFTLSSTDYQNELMNATLPRGTRSEVPSPSPSPFLQPNSVFNRSPATNSTSSFKFFSSAPKPDPDNEDMVWHEPETYSATISRKEHPRDPSSLLSLRDVLRNKVPGEGSSALTPSMFMNLG